MEQKAAVIRIKRCSATAYYEILGLEEVKATCSDSDIKKAYRKLSLLTHPDKNGYEGADEAFKMVSKAFSVLSDPDKKKKYDSFGGDPDARFNPATAGGGGGSPFPGGGFGRGGGFQEEMTPEELFRQFFGGAFGGPFGTCHSSRIKSTECIQDKYGGVLIILQVEASIQDQASSSISAVVRESASTNLAAAVHEDVQTLHNHPALRAKQATHPRPSPTYFLCSFFSGYRSSAHFSALPQPQQAPVSFSSSRGRHTPRSAFPAGSKSTTMSTRTRCTSTDPRTGKN